MSIFGRHFLLVINAASVFTQSSNLLWCHLLVCLSESYTFFIEFNKDHVCYKKNLQNKIWLWHLSYDYYSFNFRKQYLRNTLKDVVENNRSLFWVHTTPKWQDCLKMVLNRVVEKAICKSHMARQGWCVHTHSSALKHPVKSLAMHPLSLSSAIRTKGSWLVIYSLY